MHLQQLLAADQLLAAIPGKIRSKRNLRVRIYIWLMLLDCACVVGGFMLANFARFGDPLATAGLNLIGLITPIFAVAAFNAQAYSTEALLKPRHGFTRSIAALVLSALVVLLAAFSLKATEDLSRMVFATGLLMSGALLSYRRPMNHLITRLLQGNPCDEVLITDGLAVPRHPGMRIIDSRSIDLQPDS